ncbi:MAG: hypothetical protein ACLQFM_00015 [Terriglobales bacterium]|jgi:hypothetical protein
MTILDGDGRRVRGVVRLGAIMRRTAEFLDLAVAGLWDISRLEFAAGGGK